MQHKTLHRLPDAAAVRRAIDAREFYRHALQAMPTPRAGADGWTNGGLCPFHRDEHAGSFRVNLNTGAFKCFSCGAAGGDLIAFVQVRHALSFRDALSVLADTWGVRR